MIFFFRVISEIRGFNSLLFEKTKPIYSFCVQRTGFCENELEKTKPIFERSEIVLSK